MRYMLIESNGTIFNVDVIAKSNETGEVVTSFWISIKGYILKYKITDVYKMMEDRELEQYIEQNIDDWAFDYRCFIRSYE